MKHIQFTDAQMNNVNPSLLPPKPEISLSLALPLPSDSPPAAAVEGGLRAEERGIRLIQLLLTCAKHASSGNLNRAEDCLRQISELASVTGDSIQRLSARFASALAVRLVKRWNGLYNAINHHKHLHPPPQGRALFARTIPFLGIAYSIVTESLIRAMMDERSVHVVDLGSDPNLGPAILRAFSRSPTGRPSHLKLTCLNPSKIILDDLGSSLAKEASGLDLPFQFNPIPISVKDLTVDQLDLRPNEALAFVSMLTLHELLAEDDRVDAHFGGSDDKKNGMMRKCKAMTEFLTMLKSISPKFVLLVEQEVDHNHTRLVDRFVEGLHYYSAVFDCIDDARSGMGKEERLVVEEMLGREIENIVACEGLEREERHERFDRWMVRFTGAGFRPARIWYEPSEGVREILKINSGGTIANGYKIVSERFSLMICWHERPLFAVSLWNC